MQNETTDKNQTIANQVKAYDPGWYLLIGLFLSLIPVFIMSRHNSKIFPNGQEIWGRMKIYLWIFILLIVINIGKLTWALYVFYGWLLNNPYLMVTMGFYSNPMKSIGIQNAIHEAAKQSDQLSLAVSLLNNNSYLLMGLNLILLILIIRFTNKTEVPMFKELRASNQVQRKFVGIPIVIGLLIAGIIGFGSYAIANTTSKLLLKNQTTEKQVTNETKEEDIKKENIIIEDPSWHNITVADPSWKIFQRVISEGRVVAYDKDRNFFHIDLDGNRVYRENYSWAQNYKEGRAIVKDFNDNSFHIDLEGNRAYEENYSRVDDYNNGIARVFTKDDKPIYIDLNGNIINDDGQNDSGSKPELPTLPTEASEN